MKYLGTVLKGGAVMALVFSAQQIIALPIDLGLAGPGYWSILEIGGATVGLDTDNLSMAAAPPYGFINGNIGGGNITHITSSAGNFPINGTVYLGNLSTADAATAGNATGGVIQNAYSQALLAQAHNDAMAAWGAAQLLSTAGGGLGYSAITAGGILNPGVYNLTNLKLDHDVLHLTAGGSYIFNISGTLGLNSSQILLDAGLDFSDVLFNVIGSQGVAFSGGLNQESILNGIVLAPKASVSLTPGLVNGEIISGENINIASGGSVNGRRNVPDAGYTVGMLGLSLLLMAGIKRKFLS